MTCDVYEAALASAGRNLPGFRNVLDFGCGVGRVLRWLQAVMPDASFAGAEIDEAAIAWIREHYPRVDVSAITNNGRLPPLGFDDGHSRSGAAGLSFFRNGTPSVIHFGAGAPLR